MRSRREGQEFVGAGVRYRFRNEGNDRYASSRGCKKALRVKETEKKAS